MKFKPYQAKQILNSYKHVDGAWYWVKYSAHPYIGCEAACVYCYAREEKYRGAIKPEDFGQIIRVKTNAPELLDKELAKAKPELIALDGYSCRKTEKKYGLMRECLKVILKHGFPVFLLEKTDLLLKDLDLLKKINKKSYVNVSWSIVATESRSKKQESSFCLGELEPNVTPVEDRFKAMKKISEVGITTGISFMPILPYIFDSAENIEAVIAKTAESGGSYVLASGLTLSGAQSKFYLDFIKKKDPSLVKKYNYSPPAAWNKKIHELVAKYAKKYKIKTKIDRYIMPGKLLLNKKIATYLFNKAERLQREGAVNYRVWAYRKAAWAVDDEERNLWGVYRSTSLKGLAKIPGMGERIGGEIINLINNKHFKHE